MREEVRRSQGPSTRRRAGRRAVGEGSSDLRGDLPSSSAAPRVLVVRGGGGFGTLRLEWRYPWGPRTC